MVIVSLFSCEGPALRCGQSIEPSLAMTAPDPAGRLAIR